MSSPPALPSLKEALDRVRKAARQRTLSIETRAGDRARLMGYDFEAICEAVSKGDYRRLVVEPHDKQPTKTVLFGILYCFPPDGEIEDELYVKFVLGSPIVLLRLKLDGSPA